MLGVQYRSIEEPDERDTRDMWELREDLKKRTEASSGIVRRNPQI